MVDTKISALTSYTPPLDADVLPIVDTANTTTKKVTWANIKATLLTYFNTLLAPIASPTFTGTVTIPTPFKVGATSVTTTGAELNFVAGVTSAIQTQLDAKQLRSILTAKGDIYVATASNVTARQAIGSDGQVLTADSAQTNGLKWATPSTPYGADAGSTDAYAVTVTGVGSYTIGQLIQFKANTVNTGAATLNVNSLGAITIKKSFNLDLNDGDIKASQIVQVIYDGTNFQLLNQLANQISRQTNGATTYGMSTATGTQNIAHGLGVIPKSFKLTAVSSSGSLAFSFNSNTTSNSDGSSSTFGQSTNTFILTFTSGNYQQGTITADATNIIISWTKNGSPTGTANLIWEAFA